MWAVGCIFAELLTLKPLFQGAEVKATPNPFQVLDTITYCIMILYLNIVMDVASILLPCQFWILKIFLFHLQLDQLDKIFKVLGNLFSYNFSFSLLGVLHSLDDIPDLHQWTLLLCQAIPH